MNYIDEVWLEVIIMGEYLFNLTLSKSTRTIIYTHSRLLKLWFYLPKSSWITPKIALGWNRVQLGRTQSNSFKITSLDRVHEFNSVCNFFFWKQCRQKRNMVHPKKPIWTKPNQAKLGSLQSLLTLFDPMRLRLRSYDGQQWVGDNRRSFTTNWFVSPWWLGYLICQSRARLVWRLRWKLIWRNHPH